MASYLGNKVRSTLRAWLLPEIRTSLENPSTPLSYPAEWLLDIFNGGRTDAGIRVSEMTALQVSTVLACVRLISSTIGSLPFHVYELLSTGKRPGKRIAIEHGVYDLLRWEPNPEMTAFTFRQTLQAHLLLWGNGYAEIQRDAGNRPVAIWPRNPSRIRPVRRVDGKLAYKTTEGMEEQTGVEVENLPASGREINVEDVLHIQWLSIDGRLGQNVIELARQAIGLALATEKYGSKYFGNGARPGGVLEHPGKLTDKARLTLKTSWQEAQGGENAHRVAVLEEGMKWQPTAGENEKSQFLQTRQFQKADICSVFQVPPHMIGETDKTNRANTEQVGLDFLNYTIGPHLEAWEQEAKRKLFSGFGRSANKFIPKFETRRLTMPDAESRRNFYASGRQWGYLATNDVREFEDLNPIDEPWADAYYMQVNMQEMGKEEEEPAPAPAPPQPPQAPPKPGQQPGQEPDKEKGENRLLQIYRPLFRDAIARVLARTNGNRTLESFRRIFEPILKSIAEEFGHQAIAEFDREGYIDLLQSRARNWLPQDIEIVADRELRLVIQAIFPVEV